MFGSNLISVFINLLFFFAILAVAHFLGNNMAKPKNTLAIAATIMAMAMITYIPKVGYPIDLVIFILILLVNKKLEYKIAAVAFSISLAVDLFISFLIAHSYFIIPLAQAGSNFFLLAIIFLAVIILMARNNLLPSPFPTKYSGKLSEEDGLPAGYVIFFENANQKPTISTVDSKDLHYLRNSDMFFTVIKFGNGVKVMIESRDGTVDLRDPNDNFKIIVKYRNETKITFGY